MLYGIAFFVCLSIIIFNLGSSKNLGYSGLYHNIYIYLYVFILLFICILFLFICSFILLLVLLIFIYLFIIFIIIIIFFFFFFGGGTYYKFFRFTRMGRTPILTCWRLGLKGNACYSKNQIIFNGLSFLITLFFSLLYNTHLSLSLI